MLKDYDVFFDKINNCYQIRTKTNTFSIEFDDVVKIELFQEIININKVNDCTLISTFNQLLKQGYQKQDIIEVLNGLNEYGIIPQYEVIESGLEFKSSLLTKSYNENYQKAETSSILIIGNSDLSKVILKQFELNNFKSTEYRTYESLLLLINKKRSDFIYEINKYDFILLESNNWNPYFMEIFNEEMVKLNKPWLNIGGIEEASIKIGPIFFGKETGCYNCMLKRLKSNNEFAIYFESYEQYLKSKQMTSQSDNLPHLPVLFNLISNYVLLETLKFIDGWAVPVLWKGLLTINIFNYEAEKHTLLKVPYCEICKPTIKYNISPWLESITLK